MGRASSSGLLGGQSWGCVCSVWAGWLGTTGSGTGWWWVGSWGWSLCRNSRLRGNGDRLGSLVDIGDGDGLAFAALTGRKSLGWNDNGTCSLVDIGDGIGLAARAMMWRRSRLSWRRRDRWGFAAVSATFSDGDGDGDCGRWWAGVCSAVITVAGLGRLRWGRLRGGMGFSNWIASGCGIGGSGEPGAVPGVARDGCNGSRTRNKRGAGDGISSSSGDGLGARPRRVGSRRLGGGCWRVAGCHWGRLVVASRPPDFKIWILEARAGKGGASKSNDDEGY